MLQIYLERQGYDVRATYSGEEALEEIAAFQPHLLIMDLLMPDMSGLDVVIHLRADPKLSYLPVIIITAQDAERQRMQSMISGADDYLAKPVNHLELLVRVQALLRTKTQIDRLWQENSSLIGVLEARNTELEQALLEVESANMLKKNILNAVSHEMGTPMLQIKSAVHLLVEDVVKSDPVNVPAKLVGQAVNRLENIIQNLTDLARSDYLKEEPFLLLDAINLAMRNIERSWTEKLAEGRIQTSFEDDLPLILGDRRAVARVLFLLIDNALKFDPEEHPVLVNISRADQPGMIRFSVSDRGIGIPENQRERIFDEFYQIDSSTTRRFGGSGLGLALARLLCDQMNTRIVVESKINRGSTFSFTLPESDWTPT
jgi:signal transduction histidine kinase